MSTTANRQASIDSRRIALEREIAIRLPAFDTFVTEYSANLSTTGMFVVSESPQPPGTSFAFEFSVADDWKLIRGKGEVVWARYRDEGPSRAAGMGIRFTELDPQSRRLIRWIVEKHIREGGTPFDLEDLRTEVDQALARAAEDPIDTEPVPEPTVVMERPAREPAIARGPWGLLGILLSGAAVVAIIAGILWLSEPEPSPPPAAAATTATRPAPPPEPAVEAPPADSEPQPAVEAVAGEVRSWSRAWAAQDVDAYLDHYARAFQPPDGLSRDAWERLRRERVAGPASITIGITALEAEAGDEGRASAVFTQSYRSDRLADVVRKRLELVWEDGRWRILEERVLAVLQ